MVLYARGDIMSTYVTGGCGKSHSRPVNDGVPAKVFELTCPPCEHILTGGDQPDVLEFHYKKGKDGHLVTNTQGHAIQEGIKKVRPRDPHWSNDPNDLPKTGSEVAAEMKEQEIKEAQREKLESQGRALNTFAALMQIPGADPRKLADSLGIDLSAIGLDDDEPARPRPPRKPRTTKPAADPEN